MRGNKILSVPVQLIIDEAIRFERNLSFLYFQLSKTFPEDGELWWELSLAEEGHASLLESGQKLFRDEFAADVIDADLDGLRRSNENLESTIGSLEKEPLDRGDAFRVALGFEVDPNERTLFNLLEIKQPDPAKDLVDSIHRDDSVHERRIRDYAASEAIAIDPH
jgi:hypothetical protein